MRRPVRSLVRRVGAGVGVGVVVDVGVGAGISVGVEDWRRVVLAGRERR